MPATANVTHSFTFRRHLARLAHRYSLSYFLKGDFPRSQTWKERGSQEQQCAQSPTGDRWCLRMGGQVFETPSPVLSPPWD